MEGMLSITPGLMKHFGPGQEAIGFPSRRTCALLSAANFPSKRTLLRGIVHLGMLNVTVYLKVAAGMLGLGSGEATGWIHLDGGGGGVSQPGTGGVI